MKTRHKTQIMPKKCKSMRKRRQLLQNEIKDMVYNSLKTNDNNRELVERNATLLAEIETLKRENLTNFQSLLFANNSQHKHYTNTVRSDLMSVLDTLRNDRKNMIDLFQKSYEFYNQMIDKVSDKIEECVQRGDHLMVSGVEAKPMETQMNRSEEEVVSKAQSMFEAKRLSRQSGQQLVPNDAIDTQLTVVEEVSLEVTDDHQLNGTQYLCDTPSQRVDNTLTNYEFTPNFENFTQRTPSIFNFNTNSFNTFRTTRFDGVSPLSMNDTALRSELSLTDFNSFESTVTDDQKVITASTPVNANRLSSVDIQRPSKRISSINPYFSPRAGRPSLVNVQNLLENMTNNRKKSCVATNCDSKTVVNQTNSKNCVNKSKKRKKADERISCKSIESSDMSDSTCNLSTRSSRRQRKAVSYKEPSLMSKLRRSDD